MTNEEFKKLKFGDTVYSEYLDMIGVVVHDYVGSMYLVWEDGDMDRLSHFSADSLDFTTNPELDITGEPI